MDKVMSEPLEKRIQAIELKIQFLESWKNTPYIQITIPLIVSLFMATSWVGVALAQINKSIDLTNKRIDALEVRMDKLETKMDKLESKMDKLESKMDKLESKMDLVLSEIRSIKKS